MRQFDPKLVSVIIGGKIMSGFAEGSFVKVSRNEDAFKLKVGTDGEGTRVKSNNRSGMIEITLMQSSPSNEDLSGFALADEVGNTGAVASLVKDANGSSLCQATTSWVKKFADVEYSNEATTRVWQIESDEINMFVGGNDLA